MTGDDCACSRGHQVDVVQLHLRLMCAVELPPSKDNISELKTQHKIRWSYVQKEGNRKESGGGCGALYTPTCTKLS